MALAGAGVALGAAIVSFSLKRVSASSRRSLNEVADNEEEKKITAASGNLSTSTTPSNTPTSSVNLQYQPTAAASSTLSSGFGGSNSSLASIKSGRRHQNASTKSLSRHQSASSTSGLSRSGSSSWDLHGSAASLAGSDIDSDVGSLGGGGSGPSSLEYHPSGDQR